MQGLFLEDCLGLRAICPYFQRLAAENYMLEVLWIALAYVLGSVPWGLVIAKTFCHLDPRESGSRNTGATNVARLCGFGWGVATLACDVCKGAVPVWLAFRINPSPVFVSVVGLACVLGHVFSCFMKFKGGKAGVRALVKEPPFTAHKHALIGQAHGDKSIVFFSDDAVPPDLVALLAEEKQLPVARAEALHLPRRVQRGSPVRKKCTNCSSLTRSG